MQLTRYDSLKAWVTLKLPFCCDKDYGIVTGRVEIIDIIFNMGANLSNNYSVGVSVGAIGVRINRKWAVKIKPETTFESAECPNKGEAGKYKYDVYLGQEISGAATALFFRWGGKIFETEDTSVASFYISCCCRKSSNDY